MNQQSMCIYLVGPSGVGKSRICRKVEKLYPGKYDHVNVDQRIESADPTLYKNDGDRWPEFWEISKKIFIEEEQKNDGKIKLIDVGAGSLEVDKVDFRRPALVFFQEKASSLFYISDNPITCYLNVRLHRENGFWSNFPFQYYLDTEWHKRRHEIYKLGKEISLTGIVSDEERSKMFLSYLEVCQMEGQGNR